MNPSHLKAELARLRKGRGVSRPDLLAVLGPTLREILDVDDTTHDDEARSRLVSLVSGEAAGMPDDLGQLVSAAFGQPRSSAKAWILDGVLPTSFADPPAAEELITDETVEAGFDDPLLGHAYGIAWTWA